MNRIDTSIEPIRMHDGSINSIKPIIIFYHHMYKHSGR